MLLTITIIIGVILFFFLRDRDKMLDQQVDRAGGMRNKYSELIGVLTADARAKITHETRDHVQISLVQPGSATHILITESFSCVLIEWICEAGYLGTHRLKWEFAKNLGQLSMFQEMQADLEEHNRKMLGQI